MRFLIDTLMIFFGTLIAAALVALGEPAEAESLLPHAAAPRDSAPQHAVVQTRQGQRSTAASLR